MLTLVLTLAMLLSVMVVGAGAAFSDQTSIKNTEAVDACVALSIIDGKEDGAFHPTDNVTRAEMCKMICVALNGGKLPSMGSNLINTFNDVGSDHWAAPFIEYCVSQSIVGGVGGGNFNPNGNITGTQAAKMLLCILGYNASIQGYIGNDFWETKINVDAAQKGLYEGLANIDPSAALTRDEAAQIIWNALEAIMVTYKDQFTTVNGQLVAKPVLQDKVSDNGTYVTLLADKYSATIFEGVLNGSGKYAAGFEADGTTDATAPGTDYFSMVAEKRNDTTITNNAGAATPIDKIVKYKDVDLTGMVGEYVKVLLGKNDEVYGVYPMAEKNTIVSATTDLVKDQTTDSIKIDGTKYDLESDFKAFGGNLANTKADSVKFVDNDKNGKFDLAVVVPVGVAKVSFVGSDYVTFSKTLGSADLASASQKKADIIINGDIAKDDYVVFQKDLYTQKDSITKANLIEGTIVGAKTNEWQIDGTWYMICGDTANYNGYAPKSGDTVKAVAVGSKLYFIEKTDGANSVKDVVMLVNWVDKTGLDKQKGVLLFADGTKKTVELKGSLSASDIGSLFTYKVDNDDVYELTAAASMTDYTWVAGVDLSNDVMGSGTTYSIADDAVVFLISKTGASDANTAAKVVTGKELKGFTTGTSTGTIATQSLGFFYSKTNGINKATIIGVTLGAADTTLDNITGTSSANYGYLVADAYTSTENGKDYINFQVWDGKNTESYKWEKSGSASSYTKHTVIGYDVVGDGMIKNVTSVATTAAALTGGAGTNDVQFNGAGTIYKITSDTKVLYVNGGADAAKDIGVSGGTISNATAPATGVYIQNVKYAVKSGSDLELLVVDVENKLADRTTGALTISNGNASDIEVSVNGTIKAAGANVIATGDTVVIKNTSASAITISTTGAITELSSYSLAAGASVTVVTNGTTLTIA